MFVVYIFVCKVYDAIDQFKENKNVDGQIRSVCEFEM